MFVLTHVQSLQDEQERAERGKSEFSEERGKASAHTHFHEVRCHAFWGHLEWIRLSVIESF